MTERFLFTDRAEAPHGEEDSSDTIWNEFLRLASNDPVVLTSGPPFSAAPLDSTRRQVEEVLSIARQNGRVCPKPEKWASLYRILIKRAHGQETAPPLPPSLGTWSRTSSHAKAICFGDHIQWAARHDMALSEVAAFLLSMSEEDWHHFTSAPSTPRA